MNKQYYSFGNPFKVKFREHFCYKCGTKLIQREDDNEETLKNRLKTYHEKQ